MDKLTITNRKSWPIQILEALFYHKLMDQRAKRRREIAANEECEIAIIKAKKVLKNTY